MLVDRDNQAALTDACPRESPGQVPTPAEDDGLHRRPRFDAVAGRFLAREVSVKCPRAQIVRHRSSTRPSSPAASTLTMRLPS